MRTHTPKVHILNSFSSINSDNSDMYLDICPNIFWQKSSNSSDSFQTYLLTCIPITSLTSLLNVFWHLLWHAFWHLFRRSALTYIRTKFDLCIYNYIIIYIYIYTYLYLVFRFQHFIWDMLLRRQAENSCSFGFVIAVPHARCGTIKDILFDYYNPH